MQTSRAGLVSLKPRADLQSCNFWDMGKVSEGDAGWAAVCGCGGRVGSYCTGLLRDYCEGLLPCTRYMGAQRVHYFPGKMRLPSALGYSATAQRAAAVLPQPAATSSALHDPGPKAGQAPVGSLVAWRWAAVLRRRGGQVATSPPFHTAERLRWSSAPRRRHLVGADGAAGSAPLSTQAALARFTVPDQRHQRADWRWHERRSSEPPLHRSEVAACQMENIMANATTQKKKN